MLNILKKFLVVTIFALFAFVPATAFGHGGDEEFRAELDEDNEFEVRGMVDEVGDNFFTVAGFDHPIVFESPFLEEFRLDGDFVAGADVRAEGMVDDGTFFAEEVRVEEADVDEDVDEDEDEVEELEDEDEDDD